MTNPLEKQVGGTHYRDFPIQPVEFCQKNKIGFCEASAIKYLCRHASKGGKQDLEKAKHFIDMLIEMEYPEIIDHMAQPVKEVSISEIKHMYPVQAEGAFATVRAAFLKGPDRDTF